jgi:hypothetical protein
MNGDEFTRLTGSLPWQVVYRCRSGATGASYHATKAEAETVKRLLLGLQSEDILPPGFTFVRPVRDEVVFAEVEWRNLKSN